MDKSNLKIGFDLDGVIIDFSLIRQALSKELGYNLKLEETPSDVIRTIIPEEIKHRLQHLIFDDLKYSLQLPLMNGARESLAALKDRGINFYLISRRKIPEVAVGLLKQHNLWPDYFNEQNAFFVSEPKDKEIAAKKIGITHYADDEIGVLEVLNSVLHRFLFDPFNVQPESDFYQRVQNWEELMNHLSWK